MREAAEWGARDGGPERRFLILGDGPTLARAAEFPLTEYRILALSPSALAAPGLPTDFKADVLWIPDANAAASLTAGRTARVNAVLAPRALIGASPVLQSLAEAGRLFAYGAAHPTPDAPDAAKALYQLAALGAKEIRTLGVDFGPEPTPDAVRKADAIALVIQKFGLNCGPLTSEVPARIFIGSDPSQALGAKILEYSIRKRSTLTAVFDTMQSVPVPQPRDPKNQPRTQFSFSRFVIPALAGYRGRALYLDADMLTFSDLRELWEMPFGDANVMYALPEDPSRPKQTSVMLLNCERLKWDIEKIVADLDEGRYDYEGLMRDMRLEPEFAVQPNIPPMWNSLEIYVPGKTRLLHYTDMKYQPWVDRRNPHADLWVDTLREALDTGFVTQTELEEAVQDGYVRPSLLWELRTPQSRRRNVRALLGPLLDVRYKPHSALRTRLKKVGM